MKSRMTRALIAFFVAVVLAFLFAILYSSAEPGTMTHRLLQMVGGDMPAGLIQAMTFFIFIFAILELWEIDKEVGEENDAYSFRILPEQEQYVLSPSDVNDIKLKAIERENYRKYLMTDLIKKSCTKYRANKSTSEALGILSTQSKINLAAADARQSIVRYCAWAIPSIGFIGTIIGIANSLGYADEAGTEEGLQRITQALNVAFDTTLVALFLSILLMLYFHIIQEKVEELHTRLEEYVMENLINRIYKH